MCDKLVFDLSQEVEGSPNVFIRKDWINILDNQNQNYQNNQSIIDTSQLSNSNKYMSYREAYLAVPLLLSVATPAQAHPNNVNNIAPAIGQGKADYAIGLKNWFGTIIHSFTLDYNGTTICQQTPFCNMWNSFKLLTTLSYSDLIAQGPTIGFYPDTSTAWNYLIPNGNTAAVGTGVPAYLGTVSKDGIYTCNNNTTLFESPVATTSSLFSANGNQLTRTADVSGITTTQQDNAGALVPVNVNLGGNAGLTKRISWINYNPAVRGSGTFGYGSAVVPTGGIVGVLGTNMSQIWKSYISQQVSAAAGQCGLMQISVMATIYLKHVHSFFNMVPLLKGVFMKMTMNLNNASSSITITPYVAPAPPVLEDSPHISTYATTVAVGGVCPLLIPSFNTSSFNIQGYAFNAFGGGNQTSPLPGIYFYNISVGSILLDANVTSAGYNASPIKLATGTLSKSIYLYVPAYTFNPVFEQAYLSNPVKQIKYTDIYQYQVLNIVAGQPFNNLITNGIANIKSVLICPYYSSTNSIPTGAGGAIPIVQPSPVYQSPFDPAGAGCTSPMITLGNFNVQISGQNAIYNTQRYTFEEFNNQLYGQNAVNGGLTDGLTSGLIGYQDFLNSNCFYYINVERMLPVEQSVPKSVQILGTNFSTLTIDMWVFVEYGIEINVDLQTGARV